MKKKLSFKKMLDIPTAKPKQKRKKKQTAKKKPSGKKKEAAVPQRKVTPKSPKVKREAKPSEEQKPQQKKIVLFRLSNEYYAIDVSKIDEIIDAQISEKIAGMPDFVAGVISLRGESIPVLSLNEHFHLEESTPQDTNTILITSKNGEVYGIQIDELHGVIDIDTPSILDIPSIFPDEEMAYLKGIIRHGVDIAALIDIEQVLNKYRLG